MQASDIIHLAQKLENILEYETRSLVQFLGGTHRVKELRTVMVRICQAYSYELKSKEWEKDIKGGLYRLESLLLEVKAFQEAGARSKSNLESFIDSAATEAQHILEQLKPSSGEGACSVEEERLKIGRVGAKLTEELIKWAVNSKSGPVFPIFGKPRMGKSTVARLVFSACKFGSGFEIAEWVSLSKVCTRKDLVGSIIISIMRQVDLQPGIDSLLIQLQNCVRDKKYLLVLDDLSDKDFLWSMLSNHEKDPFYSSLVLAAKEGSKILLTSRLEVGGSFITLTGLEVDESWDLFQSIAFRGQGNDMGTVSILSLYGLQICRKCDNFPAAIKIIASILSSKHTLEEWKHFHDLIMTGEGNPVSSILYTVMLISEVNAGYTNRRHCYAFCSLLPKDYKFRKDDLLHLWMAHEFHKPDYKVRKELESLFSEFLTNGFFLEDTSDSTSPTVYNISNLAHELMKHVAGDDFCLVDNPTVVVDHRIIRHVSFIVDSSWEAPSWLNQAKQLQSLLLWPCKTGEFITVPHFDVSQMTSLYILHLEAMHCESLQRLLEKLKRLRYLRLGAVSCMSFFDYISAAETLALFDSQYIDAVNLLFDGGLALVDGNRGTEPEFSLVVNPAGSENLTVNYEKCYEVNSLQQTHQILEALNDMSLASSYLPGDTSRLKPMRPHRSRKSQALCWKGQIFPAKVINEFTVLLHCVISIQIVNCNRSHLPAFNALPNLRSLQLWGLMSLEYIEICDENTDASSVTPYFPSLKSLMLGNMPELKEWSRNSGGHHQSKVHLTFPRLSEVKVQGCPKLISLPSTPMLESLEAINIDAMMLQKLLLLQDSSLMATSSASSRIRNPVIDSPPELISAEINLSASGSQESDPSQVLIDDSKQHISLLKYLRIDGCKGFDWGDRANAVDKRIVSLKEAWHRLSHLRSLKLVNSSDLVSLPRGLECIATLEQLSLCALNNVKVLPEGIGHLCRLHCLTIHYCPKLTMLPESLCFTALAQLEIRYCPRLKQFPKFFPKLKVLKLTEFSRLEELLHASEHLEELEIDRCEKVERDMLGPVGTWQGLKSLRSLKLSNISKLESLPRGLECILTLEKLHLLRLFKLRNLPEWVGKLTQLRQIAIQYCPQLVLLPKAFGSLSSLEHLEIVHCAQLKQLPETLKSNMALRKLQIQNSTELEIRCIKPNGEDWPIIQHIPTIVCGEVSQ